MTKYKFNVLYPKGFYEMITVVSSKNPITNEQFESFNRITSNIKPKISNNISEEIVIISLEELFIIFEIIIKKYKEIENSFLAINEIYKEITIEISKKQINTEINLVLTKLLKRLDGTKGRTVLIPNKGYCDKYIPILKETKKHLLFLFNKFLKCPDTDIIIFEDKILFIQLFAIIIHYFQTDKSYNTGKINDCTELIKMITLLELLIKKQYKPILESALNNMLSDSPLPFSILEKNNESDSEPDDEWDQEDFDPFVPELIKPELIKPVSTIKEFIKPVSTIQESIIPITFINKISIHDINKHIPDDWDAEDS